MNRPQLIIDNTHRVVIPDAWQAEHLQVEEYEPRLWTSEELVFACFASAFAMFVLIMAGAMVWSWWVS